METKWIVGGSLAVAGLSLVAAALSASEVLRSRKLIGDATERISQLSHVEIDQRLVDQAVRDSIRTQSHAAVERAAKSAENRMNGDISNRVKQAVEKCMSGINERVAKKIASEMTDVERDEIMDEVISKTTDALVEKLGDELDGEIGRIGKIYQGIAAAIK